MAFSNYRRSGLKGLRRRQFRRILFESLEDRRLLATDVILHSSIPDDDRIESISWEGAQVPVIRNEWIVRFESARDAQAAEAQLQSTYRALSTGPFLNSARPAPGDTKLFSPSTVVREFANDGQMLLRLSDDEQFPFALGALAVSPGFQHAEPNFVVSVDAVPNDPQYSSLYGLDSVGDKDIDAPEAWDLTTGSGRVVVGVIDTGVDYSHEDLAANMWTNPIECPAGIGTCVENGIDDDGNGYVDDFYGWDFADDDNDPMDTHSHGTHVAGTIAAVGNNGTGVVGVNWRAQIMALRFIGSSGFGTNADAIRAIEYATMMKRDYGVAIKVTNNSWGGGSFSQLMQDAIQASGDQNMLFVAAAGNDSSNSDAEPHYPSSLPLDNIISVAATNADDDLPTFSNSGAVSVDLGAPGSFIVSTVPDNKYATFSGTSMAAPHVAGVVALAWDADPNASNTQVKNAVLAGVDVVPALVGKTVSGGRLNARKTLDQMGLFVSSSSPAQDAVFAVPPSEFTLHFSHAISLFPIDPGAFLVDGNAADVATILDPFTARFTFNSSPVTVEGHQTLSLAAGSVLRASDGDGVAQLDASFFYDATPLQVTSILPASGAVLSLPDPTILVNFNDPVAPGSVDLSDLVLTAGRVASAKVVDADTIEYGLAGLNAEQPLTVTLKSGAVKDLFGHPVQQFIANFGLDFGNVDYPNPITASQPLGSMIYESTLSGEIHHPADVDTFHIALDAGQLISVALHPTASLAAKIRILDTNHVQIASVSGAAGAVIRATTSALVAGGDYKVTVEGNGVTAGGYTLDLFLNAVLESESYGGVANNLLATAQDTSAAWIDLDTSASRLGLRGRLTGGADVDWYQLSLTEHEPTTFALSKTQLSGVSLTLHAGDGTPLAGAVVSNNADQIIVDYLPPETAAYFLKVTGGDTDYSIVGTAGISFDAEPNSSLSQSQDIHSTLKVLGHVGRLPPITGSSAGNSHDRSESPSPNLTQLANGLLVPSELLEGRHILTQNKGVTKIQWAEPRDPRVLSSSLSATNQHFVSINSAPEGDAPADAVFTRDGQRFLVANRDSRNILIYDANTRAILADIPVAGQPVDLAVTPDGKYALSANSSGGTVSIIDLATLSLAADIPVAGDWPYRIEVTPDSQKAVVATSGDVFVVLSMSTLSVIKSFTAPGLGAYSSTTVVDRGVTVTLGYTNFAITPDGTSIISPQSLGTFGTGHIYSIATGAEVAAISLPQSLGNYGIAFSPNGSKAYISSFALTNIITEVDLATMTIDGSLNVAEEISIPHLLVTPDGQFAVVAKQDFPNHRLHFIDLTTGSIAAAVPLYADDFALSFDGKYILAGPTGVIDVATQTKVADLPDGIGTYAEVSPVDYRAILGTPTFTDFFVVNINGAVAFREAAVRAGSPPEGDEPSDAAITPNGKLAVTVNYHSNNVSIIDLENQTVLAWVNAGTEPVDVAITPDGNYAVVTSAADDSVTIIDLQTHSVATTLTGITDGPRHVVISSSGTTAYVDTVGPDAGFDKVYFINLNGAASSVTGSITVDNMQSRLLGAYTEMALSPDGSLLAVPASRDNQLVLIDTATRTEIARLSTGEMPLNVLFAPDGTRLYTANVDDGTITVIDVDGPLSSVAATISGITNLQRMALDDAGEFLYAVSHTPGKVRVIDTDQNIIVRTLLLPTNLNPTGFTANDIFLSGNVLYVAGGPEGIYVFGPPLNDDEGELMRILAAGPATKWIDTIPLNGRPTRMAFNELQSLAVPILYSVDGIDIISYAAEGTGDEDFFTFTPQVGDHVTISTASPGSTPGHFENSLDVAVELYAPNGSLLTRSLDGSISHTVESIGSYSVRVYAQGFTEGEFVLTVTGVTQIPGPSIAKSSPPDDATYTDLDANLVLEFDKNIQAGAGNVTIKRTSDNSVFAAINVTSPQVSVVGKQVTINPVADWEKLTGYYVQIAAGAFHDTAAHDFTGIAGTTAWSFITGAGYDFADSPLPYPVSKAEEGARHRAVGPQLGTHRDSDLDGIHSVAAETDDVTDLPDDEDGVSFGEVHVGQVSAAVLVHIQDAPSGAKLDAWIDFDGDGSWGGAWEHIFDSVPVANGDNALSFSVPSWALDGTTYARFRVSTAGELGIGGLALDGEVEDYRLIIHPPASASSGFGTQKVISTLADGANSISVADLDRDGDSDVVAGASYRITWYENDGTGNFAERIVSDDLNYAYTSVSVQAIDVDGDSDIDVVSASSAGKRIVWFENRGGQSFTPWLIASDILDAISVYPSDLDNDGDVDVIAASVSDDTVLWYENNGQQEFAEHVITSAADFVFSVFARDVDRDGDVDVLSASAGDNKIAWYENRGSSGFTSHIISTAASGANTVFATDVDRDGDTDALSGAYNFDDIDWYDNNGSQLFTRKSVSTAADSPRSVFAADLDGDGDVDVLSASENDNEIAWHQNDGLQAFTSHIISNSAELARSVFAADADGDGDLDVFSASLIDDKIAWYENLGDTADEGFTVTESGITTVSEDGLTDTVIVVLKKRPADNVVIQVTPADPGETAVDTSTLSFTPANWNIPQQVTITAFDDVALDGVQVTSIDFAVDAANSDDSWDAVAGQSISVTSIDNDTADYFITESGAGTEVSEFGGSDNFSVVLSAAPPSDVVLLVQVEDPGELSVNKSLLTFTPANWNQPQTVTVTGVDDDILDGNQPTNIVLAIDAANSDDHWDLLPDRPIAVTTLDHETLAISVVPLFMSENGGTATGTVTRSNTDNSAPLVVNLSSSDTGEATVPSLVTIPANQPSVDFQITAVDDDLLDATQAVTITATASGYFDGTQAISVTDHETLTVAIDVASLSEKDGTAIGTVTRNNSNIAAALVVTLASNDVSEATTPPTVTIPANHSFVSFQITAVDDALLDGTQPVTIAATAAGYIGDSKSLDVTDHETLALTIDMVSISERGGIATGTVTRSNTDTLLPLSVALASNNTTAATVTTLITIPANQLSVDFAITAVEDDLLDGSQAATITASAAGYVEGSNSIEVTDHETLTVTIDLAAISEHGGSATGTVTRSNSDKSGALVVALSSSDVSEATVTSTVTIAANQSSATFTISAADDSLLDGVQSATITAAAVGYFSEAAAVDVTDHETLTVAIDSISITESGGSATGTVTRSNMDFGSAITINLSSDDTTEATVAASVTIPANQASAEFTITAVDDALLDGTQTATITASAAGYISGTNTIEVTDRELLAVAIDLAFINESGGSATGTVTRSNSNTSVALVVSLFSSDVSEATVPSTVTIPVNAVSANFQISGVDDNLLDGTQPVAITVSAAGYVSGTRSLDVTDHETLTVSLNAAAINEKGGSATGMITRSNTDIGSAVTVTLVADDTTEATVPGSVTIPANQSSVDFPITAADDTLLDGTQTVAISASAAGYVAGTRSFDVTDHEAVVVTIGLASISENGGSATATVTRSNSDNASALVVTLSSDDISEVTVPPAITIPANQLSTTFTISAVDDSLLDATQIATITAVAPGYASETASIGVTDHETLTLEMSVASMSENGGTATGTVTRSNTDNSAAVTVALASSDLSEATVPLSVTIPANQAAVSFVITGVDDTLLDGPQTVSFTAWASGYLNATNSISITDHETLAISIDSTTISENGGSATAMLTRSNSDTSAPLVVNLSSSDLSEAAVPTAVTIPANQFSTTFVISAVDDSLLDGTQIAIITASAASYVNGMAVIDVADHETLTVAINTSSISENGGTALGSVTRSNTDIGSPVTLTLVSSDITEAMIPSTVTIPANQVSVDFLITAIDDTLLDGTRIVVVAASAAGYFDGMNFFDVTDHETLAVAIQFSSVSENGGITAASVTRSNTDIGLPITVTLASNDASEVVVPVSVTIPANQSSVGFNITALNDTLLDGTQTATITATASDYVGGSNSVDVTDHETVTVVIDVASMNEKGGSATATVVVSNSDRSAPLVIDLSSSDVSEATVPATVVIPADQAAIQFTISAVDDSLLDGLQPVTVAAFAAGYVSGTDSVSVSDYETITLAINLPSVSENGGVAIGTVTRSNSDLGAPLTVALVSSDVSEVIVPESITIPANQSAVDFAITAVDDTLLDGTQPVAISASATGYFDGSNAIDVTDHETLAVIIEPGSINEKGGSATVTVSRSSTNNSAALLVLLSGNDPGEATFPPSVTIPANQTAATFSVSAVDDNLLDGTQTVTITASAAEYIDGTDSLDVADFETLTVTINPLSVNENGGVVTGTVTRGNVDLGSAVTVNLLSNDTTEASVPGTVTIPASQTSVDFTITAVDDLLLDGTQTATITASAAGYVSGTKSIDVTDYETLTITISPASISETGGSVAATVTRNNVNTSAPLIVTLSSNDVSEASVPSTVTIPAGQSSASFIISIPDDLLLDGTQLATLTASAIGYVNGTNSIEVTDHEVLTIAIGSSSINEHGGSAVGTVTRSNVDLGFPITINLISTDPTEATVPETITIPANLASVTFTVTAADDTLLDGTRIATITASAAGYVSGIRAIDVTDHETLSITIDVGSINENGGTATGTVTRSNINNAAALVVNLSSNDLSEATVPTTVTIPANEPSATFSIAAVDDNLLDGTRTPLITASATGYVAGTKTIDVTDHEVLTVTINPASMTESSGATTGTVTRSNSDVSSAMVVTLVSKDLSEATVPNIVTIPANQTSVDFSISSVDDQLLDGTQTVEIIATAASYSPGSATVQVTDHESLTVTIADAAISENGGSTTGMVTRGNTDIGHPLIVNLSSDDASEVTVVANITIPANQPSVTFSIPAADDTLFDGTQTVKVTAAAAGYQPSSKIINVLDHEVLALEFLAESLAETDPPITATVKRLNTDLAAALVVTVESSDTTEATVPATVTIPAGAASATFQISAVNDGLIDGTQNVSVLISSSGYVSATRGLQLVDPPFPKHNSFNRYDVTGDGVVAPLDALIIVNDLNERSARQLVFNMGDQVRPPYIDVTSDNFVAPGDVLAIVNFLNDPSQHAEGESAGKLRDQSPLFLATRSDQSAGSVLFITSGFEPRQPAENECPFDPEPLPSQHRNLELPATCPVSDFRTDVDLLDDDLLELLAHRGRGHPEGRLRVT